MLHESPVLSRDRDGGLDDNRRLGTVAVDSSSHLTQEVEEIVPNPLYGYEGSQNTIYKAA